MALISVASAKGSPGATTTALTLCATWRRPVVLADLDFAGSDLMYRLAVTPSARRGANVLDYIRDATRDGHADLSDHTVRLGPGVDVLLGASPSRAGELNGQWTELAGLLAQQDEVDVIADLGRLQPGFPPYPLLAASDLLVIVTRPVIDGVAHLLARAGESVDVLRPDAHCLVVVLTDTRDTRSSKEIEVLIDRAGLPVRVLGRLAHDTEGVSLLSEPWSERTERTLLMRSARGLARGLQTRLLTAPTPASVG